MKDDYNVTTCFVNTKDGKLIVIYKSNLQNMNELERLKQLNEC